MAENVSRNEERWARVGKIGVVVAILVGLANLYAFLRPAEPKLDCRCDGGTEVDFAPAFDELRPKIATLRESTSKYQLIERLRAAGIQAPTLNAELDKFTTEVADAIESATAPAVQQLDSKRTILNCELANIGEREAKDVIFQLPFEVGVATVDDTPVPRDKFDGKTLRLGPMKPGVALRIAVWSESYGGDGFDSTQFLLTHEDGKSEVKVPTRAYGAAATAASIVDQLSSSPVFSLFMVGMLTLLLFVLVAAYRDGIRQRIALAKRAAVDKYIRESKSTGDESNAG